DQITQMIPWTQLAWSEVHHGHLPLWNPYSGLGTPLAFNFQTAAFSLPALVGYLFPMNLAYSVQVLAALLIAGSGTYVVGRLLGLGALSSAMAATVFELSGPLVGWLGWPVGWVLAWAGWLFAATVLVLRARHRARSVALLAVVVACVVYAGEPDTVVLLTGGFVVFVAVVLLLRVGALGGSGPIRTPLFDLVCAGVLGAALSAPLLLPGAQLGRHSVRSHFSTAQALPVRDLVGFVVQGFDGLPVAVRWFGDTAYVGFVAVVLAAVGLVRSWRRRRTRPEATAFGVVAVVFVALAFVGLATAVADALPRVVPVTWYRSELVAVFALAVLAGVGTEAIVRHFDDRRLRWWVMGGFALAAAVLAVVWLFGRGHLPPHEASLRARSFLWPAIGTAAGLGGAALVASGRLRRVLGAGAGRGVVLGVWLLVVETVLLVVAGAPLQPSSPTPLSPTVAEATLARSVGSSLVGFGTDSCFTKQQPGIVPDVNVAFGVHELAVYDPLFPSAYDVSWRQATGVTGAPARRLGAPFSVFCPAVTSLSVASEYGVGYIVEPPGHSGPAGTVFVRSIAGEGLYRVPGAAAATVISLSGSVPRAVPVDAAGRPVAVSHPGPGSWRLVTSASGPSLLRLRVTDVPGWTASIDGRPLALRPFAKVMLEATVPAGRHVVVLNYSPKAFRYGVVIAVVGLAVLVVLVLEPLVVRRRTKAVSVRR
ncbi:MAG TPA: YfhO family protein, partial [Acidimicrobiales bacterium]|nr:YfhO family protein [Acidimicrobiales bacterium]